MKILKIIEKNWKLLFRSKGTLLVTLFGPLLLVLLVGLAFSNAGKYNVKVGYYSDSYNDLTYELIDEIKANGLETFKFDTEEICKSAIKEGKINTCLIFPPDMNVQNNKVNEIVFYVDYSKINLVYNIINSLSVSFAKSTDEVTYNLTSIIVQRMMDVRTELEDKSSLFTELNAQLEMLKNDSKSIDDKITAANLDFDKASFNTAELSSKATQVLTDSKAIKSLGDTLITDLKGDLKGLQSSLEDLADMNLTGSERSIVEEMILSTNDSITILSNYSSDFGKRFNQTSSSTSVLTNLIGNVSTKLDGVKDRFDGLKSMKATIKEKLASINSKINASKENVWILQTSINNINKNINEIKVTNVENIVSPITTNIKPIVTEKSSFVYLTPSLFVLMIMFLSILLSSTLIVMEKNSQALFRNFSTPTSDSTFIWGTFLTNFILVIMQLIVISGVASYFLKLDIVNNLVVVLPCLVLITVLFILLGMVVGYIFNNHESSIVAAISVSSILLILSDLLMPIESLPLYIVKIVKFNPFIIGSELVKKAMLFGNNFKQLTTELSILGIYILGLLILVLFINFVSKMQYFKAYTYHKPDSKHKKELIKDEFFKTNDDKIKNDLKAIIDYVSKIDDKEEDLVIKKEHDLFKKWIEHHIENRKISGKIISASSKERTIKLLQEEIQKQEKEAQKEAEKQKKQQEEEEKKKAKEKEKDKESNKDKDKEKDKEKEKVKEKEDKKNDKSKDKKEDKKEKDNKKEDKEDKKSIKKK